MSRYQPSVERLPVGWNTEVFDLALGAVGYESRARYLFSSFPVTAHLKVSAAFPAQQVLDFDNNREAFERQGFSVETVEDDEYKDWLLAQISASRRDSHRSSSGTLRVVVDISSLTRTRIAHIITSLATAGQGGDICVDFLYSLACFTPPPVDQASNTHVGPVTEDFAGWWKEPERALSAVVGVGYEQDKAMGAVEYLQAQDVWLFQPESQVAEYTTALNTANRALLKAVVDSQSFTYRVHDPMALFSTLNTLVNGLATTNNVILLPFGPKLFVLCSLLSAVGNDAVAVWRVSAQTGEEPVNRAASGHYYGLRVRFGEARKHEIGRPEST